MKIIIVIIIISILILLIPSSINNQSIDNKILNKTWCPLQRRSYCYCQFESSNKLLKKFPSFWISSSTAKHKYQIKQQQQHQNQQNESKQKQQQQQRLRIDCSNRKIIHLKQLLHNFNYNNNNGDGDEDGRKNFTINTWILSNNRIDNINLFINNNNDNGKNVKWFNQLINLLLNNNQLTTIKDNTFQSFSSLQFLNLASNRIIKLEQHCFNGLNKLLRLDLGSNRIKTFPNNVISPQILPRLTEINLRQNLIKTIPSKAFITSNDTIISDNKLKSSIINFDLSSNPIQKFEIDSFIQMPYLQKIYLSEIRTQQIFPDLTGTKSIEHIRLDRLRLSSIDDNLCRKIGLKLKSLIVKSNKINRLPPMDDCIELRLLDASYNEIIKINSKTFKNQRKLIDLSLNHNQIESIESDSFDGLYNLKVLNMESNNIRWIDPKAFVPLQSLRDLNLGHNLFAELPTDGLSKIIEIKVHGNQNLRTFPPIESFPYVQTLAMSYAYHCCPYLNRMQIINPYDDDHPSSPTSSSTNDFQDSILWLEDIDDKNVNLTITELAQQFWKLYNPKQQQSSIPIPIPNEYHDMFIKDLYAAIETPAAAVIWNDVIDSEESISGGDKQSAIYFQQNDRITTNKPIKCIPKPDSFMPCQDLFDWWTLRVGVWIVFPLALIGNGTVLIVLVFGRRKRRRRLSSKLDVPRFLVCNLAAADFFMGIYLGILAVVDLLTLGYFRSYAIRWQNSYICQLTGFSGVFSAELSVYTLAVITLERNYAITHAMHLNKRLSLRAAIMVMSVGWFFSIIMAILPLFGVSDYRKVAVCLPFQIDNLISFIYIISLIIFNGIAFILLMGCYLRMYCAIRGSQAWNSNDTRIAMRMGLLVFTDFLCWAPIAFFTITTISGWPLITIEEAKIFTIFILPLNACANPFLYAFFTKQFKKECTNLYKRCDIFKSKNQLKCLNNNNRQSIINSDQIAQPKQPSDCIKHHCIKHSNNQNLDQQMNNDVDCQCQCNVSIENQNQNDDNNKSTNNESFLLKKFIPNSNYKQKKFKMQKMRKRSSSSSSTIPTTPGKQFKCNSIIYQSNYRKNHIHMSLENEQQLPQSPPPPPPSIFQLNNKNDNDDLDKNDDDGNKNNEDDLDNNKSNENDNVGIKKSVSDCNDGLNSDKNNTNTNQLQQLKQNIIISTTTTTTTRPTRQHYIKHQNPTTNAMTTGILMLKNKLLIRNNNQKNYLRKMSSDSQYEFHHYHNNNSNRKDSTSTTGRSSFSTSDNNYMATKSTTSTSFFSSSGFSSSNNESNLTDGKLLLLNQHQFNRLEEKSFPLTDEIIIKLLNQINDNNIMDNDNDKNEIIDILIYNNNNDKRFILIKFNDNDLNDDGRFIFYLIVNSIDLIILLSYNGIDDKIMLQQQQQLDHHKLIDKLINYLNYENENQENFTNDTFEHLNIHSIIFKCNINLNKQLSLLDEINEDETNNNNSQSINHIDLDQSNTNTNNKTSSHEKIINFFIKNLLPKSSNNKTSDKRNSFYRKPALKKAAAIKKSNCLYGQQQRRSSSAFALNDELFIKNFQQQQQHRSNETSSQLQQVISGSNSITNSHKSDSIIQDVRSRSVISDVIIRVHNENEDDEHDDQQIITTINNKLQTSSDREISYNCLTFDHPNNKILITKNHDKYHSQESIIM